MPAASTTCPPVTNWAGNVTYQASRVHRPSSVAELRALVAGSDRIRGLGTGHSFNLVADSPGELVRLDGLPAVLDVDSTRRTVTVAGGMRYSDVIGPLYRAGYALPNLASLPHISVAGCVATATHGSGDGNQCLSASVRALELVTPHGEVMYLDRESHPETFDGSVVALGALGVVTRLTLDVEGTFDVTQEVRVDVPLEEIAECADAVFAAAYSVSVFTDWRREHGTVWLKRRADRPGSGWAGGRPARHTLHPVPGMPPGNSTQQLGVPGPWFERLPHFRADLVPGAGEELQSEYYLPRAVAAQAMTALRSVAERLSPYLHIAEVRTVRADTLWLSPAYERDSVTFHFTWVKDAAAREAIAAVEELLVPLGARPHWGKLTMIPAADLAAGYERAADFRRLLDDHDPAGKFGNALVSELFPRTAVTST
ncbi:D-arabinono-1,4-lactone oxidase [Streptomyces sp. NPDC058308]|uniref:D-arabinono-1,4-lactone oxidase n=1 Tax=Streptomyces sp. NPDC058308 TaxID=3346440 RepID=UPI0036E8C342